MMMMHETSYLIFFLELPANCIICDRITKDYYFSSTTIHRCCIALLIESPYASPKTMLMLK